MSLLNIIKYIKDNIKDNIITPNIFYKLKYDFSEKYKLDKIVVNEIFNKLFLINYNFVENLDQSFREFYNIDNSTIDIPNDFTELNDIFNKLQNLPQPIQRSKEWYDYRYNRITASDTASAIDLNPYEPIEFFILKKCDPNFPFRDNDAVCHGKKYEQIATLIYEHIYDTKVVEFGALPSDKYNILGA